MQTKTWRILCGILVFLASAGIVGFVLYFNSPAARVHRLMNPPHHTWITNWLGIRAMDGETAWKKAIDETTAMGAIAVPALIDEVNTDRDKQRRQLALIILGNIRDRRAVIPLLDLLEKENDREMRACIVSALEEMADPRAVDRLIHILETDEADVADRAAQALGNIGDPRAVPALEEAIKRVERKWVGDSEHEAYDEALAFSSAEALGKIDKSRAVEPLSSLLGKLYSYYNTRVINLLGDIRDSRATKPLIAHIDHASFEDRRDIARALVKIGDPAARPAIERLMAEDAVLKAELGQRTLRMDE